MARTTEALTKMDELKALLIEERTVLINHNGERLVELVQAKEEIMSALAQFDETEIELDQIAESAAVIKELQEINLLLTEQSLSFTEQLVQNIQKNVTKKNTYSKKGIFEKTGQTAFLDQSL